MIETKQTKLALKIAKKAHAGVTDKGDHPYINHPLWVAEQMDDEISTVVALLHDVVEDTKITFEDLSKQGISEDAIQVLKILTHDKKNINYDDYIKNIKRSGNAIALKVKLADLKHNSDFSRLGKNFDQKNLARLQKKYDEAKKILTQNE